MQFSFPCPHYACIQPPASEGFSHQPIPLIFEGEGWMIFTLAWVWFLHTRDTLEHFVSLTQQGKACESAEGDLLWALSKHGINLVGGCTLLSLIFGCVSCSDETFEGRHLKGSAACVDLIVHNWNHSVFPCNKKEPSLTCLQHLLRIWVVGLNRSLIRPVLNFDLFLYQAFWCFLQLCILNALILSYILVKCVFPLLPPPTLVWGSLFISFTTAKALCPPCPPPVLQAMLQDRACPPNPRSLEFSSIVPAYPPASLTWPPRLAALARVYPSQNWALQSPWPPSPAVYPPHVSQEALTLWLVGSVPWRRLTSSLPCTTHGIIYWHLGSFFFTSVHHAPKHLYFYCCYKCPFIWLSWMPSKEKVMSIHSVKM